MSETGSEAKLEPLYRSVRIRGTPFAAAMAATGLLTAIYYRTESLPPPGGRQTFYFPAYTYTVTDIGGTPFFGFSLIVNFLLGVALLYPVFHIFDLARIHLGVTLPVRHSISKYGGGVTPTLRQVAAFLVITFVGSLFPVPFFSVLDISAIIWVVLLDAFLQTRFAVGFGVVGHFTSWWLISWSVLSLLSRSY